MLEPCADLEFRNEEAMEMDPAEKSNANGQVKPKQKALLRPVIRNYCQCDLSFHRSMSSLKYHLLAKHSADKGNLSSLSPEADHTR